MKTMKKILKSLPFQLLLGVIIGIVLGLISNEAVMNVIVTIKFVLGELINFCVPLIVIGFIAPSITKLGKNASRILGVAVLLALHAAAQNASCKLPVSSCCLHRSVCRDLFIRTLQRGALTHLAQSLGIAKSEIACIGY